MIPMSVVYTGLVGAAIAIVVATWQQNWKLKVLFLLLLRLAIGWQFLFEGLHKIHSHQVGVTETSKPFSSEPYFKVAPGPMGAMMRQVAGIAPETTIREKVVGEAMTLDAFNKLSVDAQASLCPKPVAEELTPPPTKDGPGAENLKAAWAKYARWLVAERHDAKVKYFGNDV
ncbi:MAG: hypothetical protein ACRCZF_12845, partial [Gemmataceae bacterium]